MKRFDALITTHKTSALRKVPFLKNQENHKKMGIFEKNGHFWQIFLIFSKMGLLTELRFFCVVISASKCFI